MKQHAELSSGRWFSLSMLQQMGNIGSEVIRAINWRKKNNEAYAYLAFERALELFDMTLADPKNRHRLREIARAREIFADYFAGNNTYQSSDSLWEKYFLEFNYAARLQTTQQIPNNISHNTQAPTFHEHT